jgi:energy-coupling factor transporter ATP-binding protein EcfA2
VTDDELAGLVGSHVTSPALVLVDGRSGSGKSTFAARLARLRGATVVSTDDVAWHLHPTQWAQELLDGVVLPWTRGEAVGFRPPAWEHHGRAGSITVPAGVDLVVEGVGAGRHELAPYAQLLVWIRSDDAEARRRGIARDIALGRTPVEAERFWDEWMAAERPFLERERPWERAGLVVDGTAPDLRIAVPQR